MKKYKLKTKRGQTVFRIEINLRSDQYNKTSLNPDGIYITELKIVHQTERKIALSDTWITTLDRQGINEKKDKYWHYLEDINISIKTMETYFANGIFATCYTLKNPKKIIEKMKHEIHLKVNREYGFLFDGLANKIDSLKVFEK
jgi:hypothetical protein